MNWLRRVSGIPLSPPAAAAKEGFNAMVQTKNFPLETRGEAVSREALVQAALQEITQNYREASLSNVARSYGVSLAYVSECVRAQTGKTYKELLQKHRMETAARLLRRSDLNIQQIITQVGYENTSYFYRLFHERYGQVHGVVADALQVLDDHEQIQGGIHLAGVGGDLLRQGMLDGVEIVVLLIVGGNDPEGGLLVLRGQGIQGIQDHLVRLLAHLDGLAHSRVALFADSDQMGDDLRDIGGMVADALHIRDHLHGGGDAAMAASTTWSGTLSTAA